MSQHNKGLGSLSEDEHDPYSAPHIYYGENNLKPIGGRPRTLSGTYDPHEVTSVSKPPLKKPVRRASVDTYTSNNPKKFTVNVANTQYKLLQNEDTDGNFQITIEDGGPKVLRLGTANSSGYKTVEIRGTYMLSNLLQELTHAADHGRSWIILDERRLHENPVNRLTRLIKHSFWNGLTRNIDGSNIADVAKDPKAERMKDPRPRVYVPIGAPEQMEYYKRIAQKYPDLNLDVVQLPELIDAAYVKSINDKPGILALAMETYKDDNGKDDMRGWPYVVPGGRFNELYGWDSYMIALGLLIDGRLDLAKSMVINFCFEIKHYGKILNANRSYYLSRSQPPFLTDMALRVFKKMDRNEEALNFLKTSILAAIKEYYTVWMSAPRYDPATRLSRYRPDGLGVPPETEPSHFDTTIGPHAKKNGMGIEEFITAYNDGTIKAPELDEYFLHDRAVRESGHDTTYRLEGCCADLATVDLNSLLYKYEVDIGQVLQKYFGGKLSIPSEFAVPGHPKLELGSVSLSGEWERAARDRKLAMERFMWNEDKGMFFDFNTKTYRQMNYESATTFWTMWAGCATPRQAAKMVEIGLPKFEKLGGLVSGTEESRGAIGLDRPNRQWDYPYGWAPQQILAWVGLEKYGYQEEVQRLAYRWLFMITKAFIDYNGVVVEKYDVTRVTDPHRVDAEYGNQGLGFKGVAREGFGWVNASYQLGLTFVTSHMRRAIGACIPPDDFLSASKNERSLLLNKWGASPPTSTSNSPFTSCASSFGITPEDEIVVESL